MKIGLGTFQKIKTQSNRLLLKGNKFTNNPLPVAIYISRPMVVYMRNFDFTVRPLSFL